MQPLPAAVHSHICVTDILQDKHAHRCSSAPGLYTAWQAATAAGMTKLAHITWAQNTQGRKVNMPMLGSETQDGVTAHIASDGVLQGASKHQDHLFACRGLHRGGGGGRGLCKVDSLPVGHWRWRRQRPDEKGPSSWRAWAWAAW